MFAQQGFVRRDDIFAGFQQIDHDLSGRFEAPDKVNRQLNLGVVDDRGDIVGQNSGRQGDAAVTLEIADDSAFEHDGSTRATGHAIGRLDQHPRDPGTDGPHPHDSNLDG